MFEIIKMRRLTILTLIILVPFGLLTKTYYGPLDSIIREQSGGALYVMFFSILLFLFAPKIKKIVNVIIVFTFTSLLEFQQLLDFEWLVQLRNYYFFKLLLGNTFVWLDFLFYFIGSLAVYFMLSVLNSYEFERTER